MCTITKRITVLVLMMLLAATSLALAQNRRGGMPPGPPDPALGMVSQALRSLDLTEGQRDRIRGIVQGHMEGELGSLVESQVEARRALDAVIWSTTTSEQEVAEAFETAAESGALLSRAQHQVALDILDILTEQQQAALQQMIQEGTTGSGGSGGRRGPGGPGGGGGPGGQGHPGR